MALSNITWIVSALLLSAQVRADDTISVTTPRGAPIAVVANFPPGDGPFPAVILGSGSGTMKQKINDVVERALVNQRIAVYRFEWAYYLKDKNGKASDSDRAPEIEDFSTVLALAKADKRVDPNAIVVGGKSRGTIIAWQVLRKDPSIKGTIQLTPVCTKEGYTVDQLYPDLAAESRPSIWIAGNADPACATKTLYGSLHRAGGPARVAILRGDHSLALDATSNLAGELAADFVLELVRN